MFCLTHTPPHQDALVEVSVAVRQAYSDDAGVLGLGVVGRGEGGGGRGERGEGHGAPVEIGRAHV